MKFALADAAAPKRMNAFERYLSAWVVASMALGLLLGEALPGLTGALRGLELGEGSHINIPIAALIWLMIYPMMLKIDVDRSPVPDRGECVVTDGGHPDLRLYHRQRAIRHAR